MRVRRPLGWTRVLAAGEGALRSASLNLYRASASHSVGSRVPDCTRCTEISLCRGSLSRREFYHDGRPGNRRLRFYQPLSTATPFFSSKGPLHGCPGAPASGACHFLRFRTTLIVVASSPGESEGWRLFRVR